MIIVNIFGGLGNQMFQYALGRHLSNKLNTDFKIDYSYNLIRTDFNPKDIIAIYDVFDINAERATDKEIKKYTSRFNRILSKKFIKRNFPFSTNFNFIEESSYNFDANVLNIAGNCYLSGYWQSEKYFIDDEILIKKEFNICKPIGDKNLQIMDAIGSFESVSIHLRGRDYINKNETRQMHFTCDQSYYERSVRYIQNNVINPHFFVFSDDPEWAKGFLKIQGPCTFVEGNSWNFGCYEDLRLMSLCKHNIIANSSFSWWAAWLNLNLSKIIIAPLKWFNDPKMLTNDLIPSSWIRI